MPPASGRCPSPGTGCRCAGTRCWSTGRCGRIPPAGMAMLRALARRPGRGASRAELLAALPGGGGDEHAVETAMTRLRAALGEAAAGADRGQARLPAGARPGRRAGPGRRSLPARGRLLNRRRCCGRARHPRPRLVRSVTERVAGAGPRAALGVRVAACYVDVRRPTPADAMAELDGPCVAVPMFLAAGYHVRTDVPEQLAAFHPRAAGRDVRARPAAGRRGRQAAGRGRAARRGDAVVLVVAGWSFDPPRAGRRRLRGPPPRPAAGRPGHPGHHLHWRPPGGPTRWPALRRGRRTASGRGELAARPRALPACAGGVRAPTSSPIRSPPTTRWRGLVVARLHRRAGGPDVGGVARARPR